MAFGGGGSFGDEEKELPGLGPFFTNCVNYSYDFGETKDMDEFEANSRKLERMRSLWESDNSSQSTSFDYAQSEKSYRSRSSASVSSDKSSWPSFLRAKGEDTFMGVGRRCLDYDDFLPNRLLDPVLPRSPMMSPHEPLPMKVGMNFPAHRKFSVESTDSSFSNSQSIGTDSTDSATRESDKSSVFDFMDMSNPLSFDADEDWKSFFDLEEPKSSMSAMPTPQISSNQRPSTTQSDLLEFSSRFRYAHAPRAALMYRPRKGKYRKEF